VARSLTENLDPTVVGERILTSVRELFSVQGSTLRLRQADGSFQRLASSGEVFSQTSEGDTVPSGVGLTGRAIAEEKPVWSPDILNDAEIGLTAEMRDYQLRSGNRSMIIALLRSHEKLIGTLALSDRTGRSYADNEVALLQTFADQAALALENARLYEQTERQLKRIEALREIEKTITSTLDLTTVLNVLMEKLDIFFTYPLAATVRLFDKDTGLLEPVAARNLAVSEWIAAMRGVQHHGESYGKVVIEQQAPLVIPNLQTDPRTQNPHFYREHGLISYVGVPLIAKGEVLGVLGIYTKEAHSFANEEIELLMILAGQAAIAIHNARLYEETDRSRKELETTNRSLDRSLRQLDSLHTALAPIGAVRSIQEAIGEIIDRLIEATGADAAVVRICDKHSGDYPIIGQRGYSERFIEELGRANSGGATDWVIKHAEPILAPDIASEDRLRGKRQISLGFRSCAILPLRVHSEVSGVIQISSRTKGYFDEEQKDHLLAVARQMSITLENRELFYSLKASRDELERANRVKDEFLGVMSHELRTPLSVVLGYSRMFQERQLGPLTKDQQQAIDVVLRNSQELLEMIESIMDATKIEAGSMTAEINPVSPLGLLQEIKAAYDFPIAKNVRLEWEFQESLPLLWSDTRKLRQIVTNLINNAIKFTEEGRIVIAAEEKRQSDAQDPRRWLEFRVSDSGVGIPPEECDKIFDRFHQVDSSKTRRFEGVGLGLYIVKSFTAMLGGRVSVCSELGKGSTFTVSLPIETAP
jgi:signal transduction histidine kinase